MVDLERRLARRVEVAVVSQSIVLADNDLVIIRTQLIINPQSNVFYRLTASRQLHSRILLLIVLPERRLKRLQQASIIASQSLDICNFVQPIELDDPIIGVTYQPRRSRAIDVSPRLDVLGRRFLPTSPGGADSMNEATVDCFEAIVSVCFWIVKCKATRIPSSGLVGCQW